MLYVSTPTRITLYSATGANLRRWTLQQSMEGTRKVIWRPVGFESFGRPPARRRSIVLHGYEEEFSCAWDYGLSSFQETWNAGTALWNAATEQPTMAALLDIALTSDVFPAQVEPSIGCPSGYIFLGRTFKDPQILQDEMSMLHRNLQLKMVSVGIVASIP